MTQSRSTQFTAAITDASGSYEPIYLVEILSLESQNYATRALNFGESWICGDGLIAGSGLVVGEPHGEFNDAIGRVDEGGIGNIEYAMDTKGNVTVANTVVKIANPEYFSDALNANTFEQAETRISMGFKGGAYRDYISLFHGVIDSVRYDTAALNLDLIDGLSRTYRNLNVPLGSQYFPATPIVNKGRFIPIIIGFNTDLECIQVQGDAQGSLGLDLASTGAPAMFIKEYGQPFSDGGTVTVDSETIGYLKADIANVLGVPYKRLQGLSRGGGAVAHLADAPVTQIQSQYIYLIGYSIEEIIVVREDGEILSSGWTFNPIAGGADKPVSTLTFSEQRGVITVDVNGPQVNLDNLLLNGGWELNNNNNWTSSGSSIHIQDFFDLNPLPADTILEGNYRLGLTGQVDIYGDNYQEVATQVGQRYLVSLNYKDTRKNDGLITNGGFELNLDGQTTFTGWTITQGFGKFSVNSDFAFEGFRSIVTDFNNSGGQLYTEFESTIGTEYVVSFAFIAGELTFSRIFTSFTGGRDIPGFQGQAEEAHWFVQVGSPANPNAIWAGRPENGSFTFGTAVGTILQVGQFYQAGPGPQKWWLYEIKFPALSTTTRITFDAFQLGFQFKGYLDDVVAVQSANSPISISSYQVGTPSTPGQYFDAGDLPTRSAWAGESKVIKAAEEITRVTLRSKYNTTGQPSHFDDIRMSLIYSASRGFGGENPVEAVSYIMDNFLPLLRPNVDSFDDAYDILSAWKFSAYLPNPGQGRELLQRMAAQAGSRLVDTNDGRLRWIVLSRSSEASIGIDEDEIIENSLRISWTPLEDVFTEFYVWFGRKTSNESGRAEDFQGFTFANPTETSHPTNNLNVFCAFAEKQFRKSDRKDIYADFIKDFDTANLLLEHLIDFGTDRRRIVTLKVTLELVHLQVGDIVAIRHRLIESDRNPIVFQVLATTYSIESQDVTLKCEEMNNPTIFEDWDFGADLFEALTITENWDVDLTDIKMVNDQGVGADAEQTPAKTANVFETGQGTVVDLMAVKTVLIADTGVGADTQNTGADISETGTGAEAVVISQTVAIADAGVGTDSPSVNLIEIADTGAGADSVAVTE